MRCIAVDDEPMMLKKFERISHDIQDLELIGVFRDPLEAEDFAKKEKPELAFLDIGMPVINGIELAKRLREINSEILIVFLTAYDEYLRESNLIGADYYILKPYTKEVMERTFQNMYLLAQRQKKPVFIETFGRFNLYLNGTPVPLSGKAKEILALIVAKCGKEISNEEIFSVIWEEKEYSHSGMKTYFSALRRLKDVLKSENLEDILIATPRGWMANPKKFDCDYYEFKQGKQDGTRQFEGEFMVEYSWGESIQATILEEYLSGLNEPA